MLKITILFLLMYAPGLRAMAHAEKLEPSLWRTRKLQYLLEESYQQTSSAFNKEIRACKAAFVRKYLEKYDDQQEILRYLCRESGGVVRATADPELAQEDSTKFLCADPLQLTADEIDARWQRIHHEDCKYISESVKKYGAYEKRPLPLRNNNE